MKKYAFISLVLSLISISGNIFQNYRLAELYNKSTGKTRALFGLIELTQLYIKIYLGIVSIVALIFAIIAFRKNENRILTLLSIILSVISFTLLYVRLFVYLT